MSSISRNQYNEAQKDLLSNTKKAALLSDRIQDAQNSLDNLTANAAEGDVDAIIAIQEAENQLNLLNEQLSVANENIDEAQLTIDDFDNQIAIPSDSDEATLSKYENSEVLAASTNDQESFVPSDSALGELGINTDLPSEGSLGELGINTDLRSPLNRSMSFPPGGMPATPKPASVNFKTLTGDIINSDMRVKIRVPQDYYSAPTVAPIARLQGIIFPYTPSISIESKADYASQTPMHSNFALYFYQRSSVTPINISGKFTVSNETEAKIYVATVHLLRALTKMRSGGFTGDPDSGAPPPVCRLDAYGTFMLQNVPVAISSFKIDLPDNVDYYTMGKGSESGINRSDISSIYEKTAVPIVSTISVTCLPMYSRAEMQKFNVTQWLGEKYVRKAGYL